MLLLTHCSQTFLTANVDGKLLGRLNHESLISLNVVNEKDRIVILERVKRFKAQSALHPKENSDKSANSKVTEWLNENKKYVVLSPSHDS
jgi:hypothetical protein